MGSMSSADSGGIVSESLYVAAYWPARAESIEACAARVGRCLRGLSSLDVLLASWFLKGKRRSAANVPFDIDIDVSSVFDALLRGRNRRDTDRSVIDDLGFRLGVWNGDDDDPVGLAIKCGMSNATPGLSNAVVLDLPLRSPRGANLYSRAVVAAAIEILVEAWDPDWATVTSNSLREAQAVTGGRPVVGCLTYLSAGRGDVPPLPAPFVVERVAAAGSLISVDEDFAVVEPGLLSKLSAMLGASLLRSPS
jgi:hypothetical protein